jgi:hypothetical protein
VVDVGRVQVADLLVIDEQVGGLGRAMVASRKRMAIVVRWPPLPGPVGYKHVDPDSRSSPNHFGDASRGINALPRRRPGCVGWPECC